MDDLTQSQFLGGRVTAWQPARGYRAGVDPVLLAAAVPGTPGQTALELGCGVGVASLCLLARVPDMRITGLEIQPSYAALARRNAAESGAALEVVEADLAQLPAHLRDRQFDHVFANPPYFLRDASVSAADPGRDIALGGETPLADWVETAARRVRPKGYVSFIQRVERLPELLRAMQARLGSLQVLPLMPRRGRESQLFLIRGRKGGRAAFRLHAGIRMHEGDTHTRDQESYTSDIRAVLRDGAALPFPK
ncbi:tRNA1(Val) (adenine(37)-N6)-methyltransferase [Thalassovita gelatinovora]|uniref:tRNA1(Val) (Adenine(37)-N6)-methyltransferase n=1 Tax=Thalassovita gelatinovora TaxID=53501 RepID=A0A0P1G2Y9_THAGE|nr:methyltransferase domain-containing protein [Thalassovita gelatinovora]CUH67245.1 tRNA1(Val) (adenine(37)-N6)-methyltransferase [Thalassovita gelatinovora]SEP77749.1 tRNA1(Val) A37 N6-methylase TrmN6 [Thalassovita gelatinovora]